MEMARDGKSYKRDITRDVEQYHQQGITLIVCLLSDVEIRSIGANVKQYESACLKYGVTLFKYPIIEMAPPSDVTKWNQEVVEKVANHILENKGNVLITHKN